MGCSIIPQHSPMIIYKKSYICIKSSETRPIGSNWMDRPDQGRPINEVSGYIFGKVGTK